ncbi:MAG: HAD hydrolase-like protein [Pirellulaceae bacterium]
MNEFPIPWPPDEATRKWIYGWLFVIDWAGTLGGKKTGLLASGAPALVKAIREKYSVAQIEVLSITTGSSEERSEEIERLLGEAGIRELFDKITIIEPPAKPEYFTSSEFRRVVVIGDRPCREIANGNLAGAHTILVRDPEVSECCDEPLVGEFEGVPYKGKPSQHYVTLERLANDIEHGSLGDFLGGDYIFR